MFSEAFHEQGLQGQAQNFVLFIFVFCFRTGGNAVRFSNTFFGHFWSLKFLLLKIGPIRCFPNLSMHKGFKDRLTLAQSFGFCLCFYLKTGEMLPVLQKNKLFGSNHTRNSWTIDKDWVDTDVFEKAPVFTGSEKYWLAWHPGKTELGNISPVLHR